MKHTHIVLDLVYAEEEGQDCFDGTFRECNRFVKNQGGFGYIYKVVPMTKKEIKFYNIKE